MPLLQTIQLHPPDPNPRLPASAVLRAFQQEAQMSCGSFNRLGTDICHILSSPSYDVLLDLTSSDTPDYVAKLADLTCNILGTGVFGPRSDGQWHYSRHPDREMIVAFIGRLTAHEAMGIMAWDDPWNIEADKVDGWLMNEEATIWDQYQFMDRDQPVGNQDYGDVDNCPAKAPSRAHTSSVTRVPETDYAHTEIGETVHAAELVGGLFH